MKYKLYNINIFKLLTMCVVLEDLKRLILHELYAKKLVRYKILYINFN